MSMNRVNSFSRATDRMMVTPPTTKGSMAAVTEPNTQTSRKARAMKLAKGREISTFLIGHVTKEGNIAGPRVLEHLVDTVLYLEGDGSTGLRILRAVKNRFGSTGEIGLFEMRDAGLAEVPDASARLLEERLDMVVGVRELKDIRFLLDKAEQQSLIARTITSDG